MFKIVIDTREQEPYGFDCDTVRKKLEAGDYSVEGLEEEIAVERKSLDDLVNTVFHSQARFEKELEKLTHFTSACIVIEADLDAFLHKVQTARSQVDPMAVLYAVLYQMHKYDIPFFWCGSRQAARAFVDGFLRTYVRVKNSRNRD